MPREERSSVKGRIKEGQSADDSRVSSVEKVVSFRAVGGTDARLKELKKTIMFQMLMKMSDYF